MKKTAIFLFIFSLLFSQSTFADESREFLLSCTYGVLAGALVGAATLATEDQPDEHLDRIAKGASLGLYTGILLGLYVVYVVPAQLESEEQDELEQLDEEALEDVGMRFKPPRLTVYPVIEQNRITGAAMNYSVLRF